MAQSSAQAEYGRTDRLSVLALKGEVRYLVARPLRAFVDEVVVQDGSDTLVIDLHELDLIDSTGLGIIARLGRRMLEKRGRRAIIVGPRPDVAAVLRAAAFDVIFEMVDRFPFEASAPLSPIPLDEPFDTGSGGPVILEAHRDLVALDERNRKTWGTVIDALAAQLEKKEPGK
jgi:anti-anti-sigma factor